MATIMLMPMMSVVIIQYVVLHVMDKGVLGFLVLQNHPKQPQFSFKTAWQYWLSLTKPKNAFRATPNPSNKI